MVYDAIRKAIAEDSLETFGKAPEYLLKKKEVKEIGASYFYSGLIVGFLLGIAMTLIIYWILVRIAVE